MTKDEFDALPVRLPPYWFRRTPHPVGLHRPGDPACPCSDCGALRAYVARMSPAVRAVYVACLADGLGWEPGVMDGVIDGPPATGYTDSGDEHRPPQGGSDGPH